MALDGSHWEEIDVFYADTLGWGGSDHGRFKVRASYVAGKFWLHAAPKDDLEHDESYTLNAHNFEIALDHEQMAALIQHVLETETWRN